jgi:hypothetical protein
MTTLKISDLSVGDWVQDNYGNYVKVEGIWLGSNFNYHVDVRRDGMIGTIAPCNIHPIPITAEILEKNGLEYVDDGNDAVIFFCCDMFWARLCVGDTFWQVGIHSEDRLDAVVCDVKHAHQLQHALRLAGVEKEITL